MDPYAAIALAMINLVTEMIKGQTPEQKKILWDWYIKDMTAWRKFFHIDNP